MNMRGSCPLEMASFFIVIVFTLSFAKKDDTVLMCVYDFVCKKGARYETEVI